SITLIDCNDCIGPMPSSRPVRIAARTVSGLPRNEPGTNSVRQRRCASFHEREASSVVRVATSVVTALPLPLDSPQTVRRGSPCRRPRSHGAPHAMGCPPGRRAPFRRTGRFVVLGSSAHLLVSDGGALEPPIRVDSLPAEFRQRSRRHRREEQERCPSAFGRL